MEPAYFVIERMALRAITCFQGSRFQNLLPLFVKNGEGGIRSTFQKN